jgi:hypothetical protein
VTAAILTSAFAGTPWGSGALTATPGARGVAGTEVVFADSLPVVSMAVIAKL